MKKQAKGNETPQRASRQVLGDLGLLFCGDEACDNREDHKRAADEHADNLHGFAVLDAIDKLVKFFKVEVLFKPVFAADLQNTAECQGACSEKEPETGVGSHAESAHSDQRSDENGKDRRKQESDVHKRN